MIPCGTKIRPYFLVLCVLCSLMLVGCVARLPHRALGVPGAASRTPDLALPLSERDYNLALLYLEDKRPPVGRWDLWDDTDIAEELETVTPEVKMRFGPLLDVLLRVTPGAIDLDADGLVGSLFEPAGAADEALDARFRGQIITGDLRVGKLQAYYFVFYRRYPQLSSKDATCEKDQGTDRYCRLVIVKEAATRKD